MLGGLFCKVFEAYIGNSIKWNTLGKIIFFSTSLNNFYLFLFQQFMNCVLCIIVISNIYIMFESYNNNYMIRQDGYDTF